MVPRCGAEARPRCHGAFRHAVGMRGGAAAAAAAAAAAGAARLNGAFRAAPQLASVGYLVGAAGITFPGEIAKGVTFASVNADGALLAAAALAAVPASQVG